MSDPDAPEERYELSWPGKRAARASAAAAHPGALVDQPDESLPAPGGTPSAHRFVEGDSLAALQLLRAELLGDSGGESAGESSGGDASGQVKMVYLDPPYNTGKSFVYADRFADHAGWLSFLYPRLLLTRELMREDGVGFLSLDRREVAQATLLLHEVFGERNVFADIVWVSNLKGRQLGGAPVAATHEFVLCFARDADAVAPLRGSAEELRALMPSVYKGAPYEIKHDERGAYVTKNHLRNSNSRYNELTAPSLVFRIHHHPVTGEVRVTDVGDPTTFEGFAVFDPHPNAQPGVRFHAWRWSRAKILAESEELEFDYSGEVPRIRTKVRDVDGMTLKDVVLGPSTVTGQAELAELGLAKVFETPKPVALLELLVGAATSGDDLVLDYFAGSASTAHAVLARNARDGARRRHVMVQLDETCPPASMAAREGYATIADVGRERLRRVAARLAAEGYEGDVGFRAQRVV